MIFLELGQGIQSSIFFYCCLAHGNFFQEIEIGKGTNHVSRLTCYMMQPPASESSKATAMRDQSLKGKQNSSIKS
jgi:hypothetical protein